MDINVTASKLDWSQKIKLDPNSARARCVQACCDACEWSNHMLQRVGHNAGLLNTKRVTLGMP